MFLLGQFTKFIFMPPKQKCINLFFLCNIFILMAKIYLMELIRFYLWLLIWVNNLVNLRSLTFFPQNTNTHTPTTHACTQSISLLHLKKLRLQCQESPLSFLKRGILIKAVFIFIHLFLSPLSALLLSLFNNFQQSFYYIVFVLEINFWWKIFILKFRMLRPIHTLCSMSYIEDKWRSEVPAVPSQVCLFT